MSKSITNRFVVAALVAATLGGTSARADQFVQQPVPHATVAEAGAESAAVNDPLGAKPIDRNALAKQRGGTDAGTLSDMKLNGVVGNNSASNLSTGNNAITDGAFAGVNGVPLVVQNSGNNVLIQSATIINVQVK